MSAMKIHLACIGMIVLPTRGRFARTEKDLAVFGEFRQTYFHVFPARESSIRHSATCFVQYMVAAE
jgi:hypothetical protein